MNRWFLILVETDAGDVVALRGFVHRGRLRRGSPIDNDGHVWGPIGVRRIIRIISIGRPHHVMAALTAYGWPDAARTVEAAA